jgi:hypothetical protein
MKISMSICSSEIQVVFEVISGVKNLKFSPTFLFCKNIGGKKVRLV